jgi:hypothetical protein
MQNSCSYTDDTNSESGVHECLVEVFSLELWHSPIFTGFAVEDEVCGDDGSSNKSSTVEETLGQVSGCSRVGWLIRRSLISAFEGIAQRV